MIDVRYRKAICEIEGKETYGTGFLVSHELVLTALHCVDSSSDEDVFLNFCEGPSVKATIAHKNEEVDLCLLRITTPVDINPIRLLGSETTENEQWHSFGYPVSKGSIGHKLGGEISRILANPEHIIDIDLNVVTEKSLESYKGLSGAPLMVEGFCVGIIRLKMDYAIGALSIKSIAEEIAEKEIEIYSEQFEHETNLDYLLREGFQNEFEELISGGEYHFLEGVHGIGKTTFCKNYAPQSENIHKLGTYALLDEEKFSSPDYRVRTNSFMEWVTSTLSVLINGKPIKYVPSDDHSLADTFHSILNTYNDYCVSHNKTGFLFIDGLNETTSREKLSELLSIFPRSLPSNIGIIFTATNFTNFNRSLPCEKNDQNSHKLPVLSDYQCEVYCRQKLSEKTDLDHLVDLIIAKVCGHPLYLRYLVEEISSSETEFDFESIPAFRGDIEDYYEKIWSEFSQDSEAIKLLGIICRIREAISKDDFLQILTPSQKAASIATFLKIQHLLERDDVVWVYHNSFSQFIERKTQDIDLEIHSDIATACLSRNKFNYAVINVVYHHLKGNDDIQSEAVKLCCQQWADRVVQAGVNPDQLNFDIESAILASCELGMANETVRLLLLSQRIKFRNNSLFFRNAFLVAKSLISIGKYQDALFYVIRYDTLIISYPEALDLAYMLILKEEYDYAYELLIKINKELYRALRRESYPASEFIEICQLLAWTTIYLQEFTDDDFQDKFTALCRMLKSGAETLSDNISQEELQHILGEITHIPQAFSLFHHKRYNNIEVYLEKFDISQSDENYDNFLKNSLLNILHGCVKATEKIEAENLKKSKEVFKSLYSDIERYSPNSSLVEIFNSRILLSRLIEAGAPVTLIESIHRDFEKEVLVSLRTNNRVGVDFLKLSNYFRDNQIESFRSNDLCSIDHAGNINPDQWEQSLIQISKNIALLDGSTRKIQGKGNANTESGKQFLNDLDTLLNSLLKLKLSERFTWQNSYFIPESVIPWLLQKCLRLYCDVYPEEIDRVINAFSEAIDHQFGIYCEGGAETIKDIVLTLFGYDFPQETVVKIVRFIDLAKTYALERIENRHDLIPFLLKLSHWYANFGAIEKAKEAYTTALAYSMGPTWYKEDQFSILLESFKNLDVGHSHQYLPIIENTLNDADGEITFQRFVRYEKENLFGHLIDKGMAEEAFSYFKKQTCGSIHELAQELERDKVDRISQYVGNCFPGNSIDERGTILQIKVEHDLDWRLHFALLKIYAAGDSRHLEDIAEKYAQIFNVHISEENHIEMCKKVLLHDQSGLSESHRAQFRSAFYSMLEENTKILTENYFVNWDNSDSNTLNTATVKKVTKSEKPDSPSSSSDSFYTPGLFGTRESQQESAQKAQEAENQDQLGNKGAARDAARDALKSRQAGGWGIWNSIKSHKAEWDFITNGCNNSSELIQVIAPLISSEQHAWEWKVAENVISLLSSKQGSSDSLQLIEYVNEHIRYILVAPDPATIEAERDINGFSIDDETFNFIVWLADHPKRARRDLAAEALADLLTVDSKYWALASKLAFSNREGYSPDILCGILKYLAQKDCRALWGEIKTTIEEIDLDGFTHASRFSVLYQILVLLDKQNLGAEIKSKLVERFIGDKKIITSSTSAIPEYLIPVSDEVNSLIKSNICGKEVFASIIECLLEVYQPLTIDNAKKIEALVLKSFRELDNGRLDRFKATLRWALNVSLFKYMSQENCIQIENTLRLYNPSLPCLHHSIIDPEGITYLQGLRERNIRKIADSLFSDEKLVLSHQEMLSEQDEIFLVEVRALIIAREMNFMPVIPPLEAEFRAVEYPKINFSPPRVYETCSTTIPMRVPLGGFTPAVPLPEFLELTNTKVEDFHSEYWTKGSSQDINNIGMLDSEGERLSILKESISIPASKKLVWAISIKGRVMVIIDEHSSFIYRI